MYADDTLLLGAQAELVGEFAAAVGRAGAAYGMTLHWDKTQALSICMQVPILTTDGMPIAEQDTLGIRVRPSPAIGGWILNFPGKSVQHQGSSGDCTSCGVMPMFPVKRS